MRTLLSTLLFTLIVITAVAQAPSHKKLEIKHLTGDFYIYVTYQSYKGQSISANGMYLVTNEGVILFDSPWDTTQFQPLLDSIQARHHKKVIICIATHSHEDRTAGLSYYKEQGIKTYTTKLTDSICKANKEPRSEFTISKDSLFTVGQYSFKTIYAGAGHTVDNIAIWFPKEKIIYGGCLIKSIEATDLGNIADADLDAWPTTIHTIQQTCKKPNYIITGHQDWTSKKSLEHTLELLQKHNQSK